MKKESLLLEDNSIVIDFDKIIYILSQSKEPSKNLLFDIVHNSDELVRSEIADYAIEEKIFTFNDLELWSKKEKSYLVLSRLWIAMAVKNKSKFRILSKKLDLKKINPVFYPYLVAAKSISFGDLKFFFELCSLAISKNADISMIAVTLLPLVCNSEFDQMIILVLKFAKEKHKVNSLRIDEIMNELNSSDVA